MEKNKRKVSLDEGSLKNKNAQGEDCALKELNSTHMHGVLFYSFGYFF